MVHISAFVLFCLVHPVFWFRFGFDSILFENDRGQPHPRVAGAGAHLEEDGCFSHLLLETRPARSQIGSDRLALVPGELEPRARDPRTAAAAAAAAKLS